MIYVYYFLGDFWIDFLIFYIRFEGLFWRCWSWDWLFRVSVGWGLFGV